ncbi:MAG: transposase [Eubacteriales bacterium]
MPRIYTISAEEAREINKIRKNITDKQVDKRLRAVQLRGEGKKNPEIAKILETSSDVISIWVATYAKGGIEALLPKKHPGGRRNLKRADEAALLSEFEKRANDGQIVEISEIKQKYQEAVGHQIGNGQIYRLLARHNWRKVKPRSRHPKKASSEVIEASKKLTFESKKPIAKI